MTTSWAYLTRGQIPAAMQANVSGTLLGMLAMIGAVWLLVSAARGRWLPWTPTPGVASVAAVLLLVIALVQWVWRLFSPSL
jgi:hypothetical protein